MFSGVYLVSTWMLKDQEAEDQKLLQLHEFDGKGDRGS